MRTLIAALFALLLAAPAMAQQFPTVNDHTVIGRIGTGTGSGPSQQIPFANLGPFIFQTITGDCVITSPLGVLSIICTKTNGVAFAPSATTDTTNASNISSGTLANARLAGTQNTVKGAATSAVEADLPMPSCSALQWTTNTGFSCSPVVRFPGGRLTAISGVPAMTNNNGNTFNATNVFYAPYIGNLVPIWNGTSLIDYQFTSSDTDTVGLTLALGSNWTANTVYDVYVGLNAGSPVLCSVAWTNATTRATALQSFRGLQSNGASATCRTSNSTTITCATNQCTYVGTFLTDASNAGQITYSFGGTGAGGPPAAPARLSIWNMYNRILTSGRVSDSGARYTYTLLAFRQDRASTSMQVNYVVGLTVDSMQIYRFDNIATNAAAGSAGGEGIGIDATNSITILPACSVVAPTANVFSGDCQTAPTFYATLGSHFIAAVQQSDGTNALNFDNVQSDSISIFLPM